ncbi:MAG: DUF4163 domain-containing protein [Gelidibacter sp.]
MKNLSVLIACFFVLFSCHNDSSIAFREQTVEMSKNAIVDISYPKAEGTKDVAQRINNTIENFLANEINMNEKPDKNLSLNEAIKEFDKEYQSFKEDFSDSTQQWEASIESEINYETETFVCISINSYLDTGGAHGNSHVTFLNFDKKTGALLKQEDIIKDVDAFKKMVQPYFEQATKTLSDEDSIEDPFFGEGFQLPENIGFGPDGIILLYNVYEIASYAQGVTEFSIPYETAKPFLKIY